MTHRGRHYWLVLYWAGFALLVFEGGRNPGFIRHPELATYPLWRLVAETVVLAVLTMWLKRLLYRPSAQRAIRWAESMAFAVILILLASPMLVTDQPGDEYAVAYFAAATLVLFLVQLIGRVNRARVHSSSSGAAV